MSKPISTKTDTTITGWDNNGAGQRESEHIEATAGTIRQLQPDVPSATWGMGERTINGKVYHFTNPEWIDRLARILDGDIESSGSGGSSA